MRHRKAGIKLNRTTSHRIAMFRNMVTSLLKHERIRTTDVKAKELRRLADQMITLAKRGDLHARRQVAAIVREPAVVQNLFDSAEKRFGAINGGYTRCIKYGIRPGDAAPMTIVELVGRDATAKAPVKAPAKAKKDAAAPAISVPKTEPVAAPAATEAAPTPEASQPETVAADPENVAAESMTSASATEATDTVSVEPAAAALDESVGTEDPAAETRGQTDESTK